MTDSIPPGATADEAARALWAGDAASAAALYAELTRREPTVSGHWVGLGLAKSRLGDRASELAALESALALEPRLLVALLLKGANLEDGGDKIGSGQVFKAALTVAPPFDQVSAELRTLVRRAHAGVTQFQSAYEVFIREALLQGYQELPNARLDRFDQSVDVLLGKKTIYRQNPNSFYFPGLPEAQFYERDRFPWLAEVEAASGEILEEFETVFRSDHGSEPYIAHPPGAPIDQWAELNHSPRWSAFHLIRNGELNPGNSSRCPRTMALMRDVPSPGLPGRSPNAMYSLLQPRTRIPPHTGETNARLVVHIPLVIPSNTGFRVGNDVRSWRFGEAFVFNDVIEHEAWNDSDQVRAVFIFDIWHPDLTPEEQIMVARLMRATSAFLGQASPGL